MLTMPEPAPVALIGDLLATQAKVHGAAAVLVDAAVRDVEELRELGPADLGALGARPRRRPRTSPGTLDEPVVVGGVDDPRRATSWCSTPTASRWSPAERVDEVLEASQAREDKEARQARAAAGGRAVLRDRRAARRRRGLSMRPDVAHLGPVELLTPEGRGEPGVLRRRHRAWRSRRSDGRVRLPARVGRLPALVAQAHRVRHVRHGRARPAGVEPRRRCERRVAAVEASGLGEGWTDGDLGRGPVLPLPRPRRPRLRALLRGRALPRRPSTCARR